MSNNFFAQDFESSTPVFGPLPFGEYEVKLQQLRVYRTNRDGMEYEVPHLVFTFKVRGDVRLATVAFRYNKNTNMLKFRRKVQELMHALNMTPELLEPENRRLLYKHYEEGGPLGRICTLRLTPNFLPDLTEDREYVTQEMVRANGMDPEDLSPFQRWTWIKDSEGQDVLCLHSFRKNYGLVAVL